MILRAETSEHFVSVVRPAAELSLERPAEEFVMRDDFRRRLSGAGQTLPSSCFTDRERLGD